MQAVLEELLLRARLVDAQRMRKAKEIAQDTGCTLAHALVKLGFVSDRGLAALLSQALNLRVVDPSAAQADAVAIAALAGAVAYRLRVLPLRLRTTADGEFVFLAMSDPTDRDAVREVEASTGREVVPAVAEERALERALRRHYASEGLKPVQPREAPPEEDDPPLVVGVLDVPPTMPTHDDSARDDQLRAQLLANDDGDFFTESTEELMTVYSRALARAERGSDDRDLMWLQERQELAGNADSPQRRGSAPASAAAVWPPKPEPKRDVAAYEDVRTSPLSVDKLASLSALPPRPAGALPLDPLPLDALPLRSLPPGEERTEPDLQQTLAAAKRELFRPPTCVVADDLELRSLLGVGLAGYVADLHVEPSLYDALVLGEEFPLGYVVVVAPRADPGVVREIQRVSEMAGAPRVVVAGGDPAFQVVPGVATWIDLGAVGKQRFAEAILEALQDLEARGLERP